ncbi:MAG: ABC transporter substrate-binding protein [Candidatus Electrothrix sp. AR3]|nr:ABC transporter substrate-binding protein [Candidatus Electrothrix sp. AR3]
MCKKVFLVLFFLCLFISEPLAAPLQVSVSIAPIQWLAKQLGGNLVSTQILLDKGQDPHSFQPTPEQVTTLFRSQLYCTVGLEFEQELRRKIQATATETEVIDLTKTIQKKAVPHHEHQYHDRQEQHHRDLDPHLWLAPQNLQQIASVMAAAFTGIDPKNAAVYARNLEKVQHDLFSTDEEIKHILALCNGQTLLVFHPAFGYFTKAYGLHQESVEIEGKSPSPKQLYALVRKAKKEKIKALFVQPQFDQRNARSIIQAIDGKIIILDPLAENIPQNLKQMAKKIRSALSCR